MEPEELPQSFSEKSYPAWVYFFPMYILLFCYALLGKSGFIIVVDPASDVILYYLLTYCILFPVIFVGQWVFYRVLSRRVGVYWRNFPRRDKILILTYNILGVLFYLLVEQIFGVNKPYNPIFDFDIGSFHVYTGDLIGFFIAFPLLMIGFHGINYAICHQKRERRQYQFFLVVLGTSVVGTITQDWFWFISAPSHDWGPGFSIYFTFSEWIHIPFTPIYIPVVYLVVALIALGIWFLSTVYLYSFRKYLIWCVGPYLCLVLIGNILFFAF